MFQSDQELMSKQYGCKVILGTFLASYPQLHKFFLVTYSVVGLTQLAEETENIQGLCWYSATSCFNTTKLEHLSLQCSANIVQRLGHGKVFLVISWHFAEVLC